MFNHRIRGANDPQIRVNNDPQFHVNDYTFVSLMMMLGRQLGEAPGATRIKR